MQVAQARLRNQNLISTSFSTVVELVTYMGALQAQDANMARWAVGVRLGCSDSEVQNALDAGEILRTHVLRPTWHLVAASDLRMMLKATAPHVKRINYSQSKNTGWTKLNSGNATK